MGKTRKLPEEALRLLEAQGLATGEFILAVAGDMNNDGDFRPAWLAFDQQGLYVAFGRERKRQERIEKKKKKRPGITYFLDSLQAIPAGDITELKIERYVSTGRLIAVEHGEDIALTRFSIGLCSKMQQLCDCFNAMKENRDMAPFLREAEHGTCPKCGEDYPDQSKVCPQCGKTGAVVKRLFGFFGGYIPQILVTLLLLIGSTVFVVLLPKLTTQTLFDTVLNPANTEPTARRLAALGWLVLSIIGVRALDILLKMGTDWIQAGIVPKVAYDIQRKIFSAMQRLSVNYYASRHTGQLMEQVSRDAHQIHWFFLDGLPYIFVCTVQLLATIVMMFTISWKLTLAVLLALPVILPIVVLGDKLFRRLHHREWASAARLSSMVSDNINGQRVIKAFSQEQEELQRFGGASENLREAELGLARRETVLYPLLAASISVLGTGVLVLGGLLIFSGEVKIGGMLSFVVYLNMLQTPLEQLSWMSNFWARCKDSAHRVFEIVDAQPEVLESEQPVQLNELQGQVELRELEFEYEPARPVIKRVNLQVGAGQMLGIVGKTGAGKTTIANLISRLYDAKAGAVLLDGVDVKDLPTVLLRKNIGLVSQDIYLFTGSIADNIRYAKPEAELTEVMAAAKAAAAHDFIMRLPDAYETWVGNGGQELSGGERQRISIARAILQNPKILILDEATAAMDTATERSIQESLAQLKTGRTTIAIAHRLSTLRDADMLAVIANGELQEFGSFSELLRKRGAFYELYQVQQEALATMGSVED